jgi:hypothetical protein
MAGSCVCVWSTQCPRLSWQHPHVQAVGSCLHVRTSRFPLRSLGSPLKGAVARSIWDQGTGQASGPDPNVWEKRNDHSGPSHFHHHYKFLEPSTQLLAGQLGLTLPWTSPEMLTGASTESSSPWELERAQVICY